ncbi:MAG TPA: AAA family ATPase, partial [Phycisphaerae bacterium]|nr:AAA family ATPase [Phycisphaerae bacterium]
ELTTCPPSVQAACLRVVHERVVGDTPLPVDTVRVLAMANPPEQAAGGWSLSPPMANRFVHLHWKVSHMDWCKGMMENWQIPKVPVLPDKWADGILHARGLVTSYISRSPTSLQAFPKDASAQGLAWPSCRTWDYAATGIAAALSLNLNPLPFTEGCVGSHEARKFQIWLKNLDLPDPEVLLAAPEKFIPPERQDKLFAVLTSVTAAFAVEPSETRWFALWKLYAAVAKSGKPDMIIVPARSILHYDEDKMYPTPPGAAQLLPMLHEAGLLNKET